VVVTNVLVPLKFLLHFLKDQKLSTKKGDLKMPVETHDIGALAPTAKKHIALIGPEGVGKSTLAATGRKPVLFLDYDQKAESLAGRKGVYAKTFRDAKPFSQPDAAPLTLDILTALEKECSLKVIGFDEVSVPLGTLVIDSMATFARALMAYNLYVEKDLRREIVVKGGMAIHVSKSFDGWSSEMQAAESIILRAMALPCDLIVTFHQTEEESPDSTGENVKLTGKITTFPVRHKRLLRYFPDVWVLERINAVPSIQTIPNWKFTAECSLNLSGKAAWPNITEMIEYHRSLSGNVK
jgi:hypothetical protein